MNFNRSDSLKFMEVLNDPKFVTFLRKWEIARRPSAVRAIFTDSNLEPSSLFRIFFLIPFFISFFLFSYPACRFMLLLLLS